MQPHIRPLLRDTIHSTKRRRIHGLRRCTQCGGRTVTAVTFMQCDKLSLARGNNHDDVPFLLYRRVRPFLPLTFPRNSATTRRLLPLKWLISLARVLSLSSVNVQPNFISRLTHPHTFCSECSEEGRRACISIK